MKSNKINIIKIGGNIIDNPVKLDSFLRDFSTIEGCKILVHGGGKLATDLANKLGIESQLINGRRITDESTLDICTMVYAGLINKKIVAKLQSINCLSIGLSGADAGLMLSKKRVHESIDYGFVGDPVADQPNINILKSLLEIGICPVFCAITHDGNGQLLNTNADTIAATLAKEISKLGFETTLVYCFEKKGVLVDVEDDSTLIKTITPAYFEELKTNKIVFEGMLPKLENAFESINQGVKKVKICMAEDVANLETSGTTICL